MKTISLIPLSIVIFFNSFAQQPKRKAWLGGHGSYSPRGFAIDSVATGSSFNALGIKKGDTVTHLNTQQITEANVYNRVASEIREGDKLIASIRRGPKTVLKKGSAIMRPYDTMMGGEVVYGWTSLGTCTLRTIVRKPKGNGQMPVVLFVPGYNCGSVEGYSQGSYGKLISTWIQNGFAVVTIEKTGLGDSYGCIPCMDADLALDIQVFETGYRYMRSLQYADTNNLFIFGHSMGGIIAPIVAQRHKPKGVIAFATVYRPWSEFLLEMHRVQWPLDGKTYAETEDRLRLIQKIYYEYFRLKRTPADLHKNPEYRDLVETELEYKEGDPHMWGRHWNFWRQLDSVDLARSWSNVEAKVLSVFGGSDFVACSRFEHELIVRAVNSSHPGNAEFIEVPEVDHLMVRNPDWQSAHKNFMNASYRNDHFHQQFADIVTEWMKKVMKN